MIDDLGRAAEEFISSAKLGAKTEDIRHLADSPYGQNVKAMLQNGVFEKAVQSGNTDALKGAISEVMKTEDGARLMRELSRIMDK